jgi:hypothetical protein
VFVCGGVGVGVGGCGLIVVIHVPGAIGETKSQ